jgi:hypothetical protein
MAGTAGEPQCAGRWQGPLRIAGPQKEGRMAQRRQNPLEGGQRSPEDSRGPLEDIRILQKTTGSEGEMAVGRGR